MKEGKTSSYQNRDAALDGEVGRGNTPKQVLSVTDAVFVIVGIVVGAGIFRTPSIVASHTGSWQLFLFVWGLGGVVSLVGAMCYAELTAAFPNTGGDYHFLYRAFGRRFAFLFAWARMSVIQTGSIALLAFIVGDYMAELYAIGPYSSSIYAAIVVIGLTMVNIVGVHVGTSAQKILVSLQFIGLFILVIVGLFFRRGDGVVAESQSLEQSNHMAKAMGAALIMVLLTFGGWNEAGYISAEMRGGSKKMATVMVVSILLITGIYLLINLVYLHVLGMEGMAQSDAVAVDMMRITMGEAGVVFIGLLVMIAALTSTNATIFTGARTNHALGRDFPFFSFMGKWQSRKSTPVNALLIQGAIATVLIVIGSFARSGFESMVDFTAPVFWFFILCTGIALFVLRYKESEAVRPFKVPFYPVLPFIFCLSSGYLLYSSLVFASKGAWLGIIVLALGMCFFWLMPGKGSEKM
ncbi:APC family permease [Sphingobacterium wenxiniae]|uniref:Amino acid transporter n=1 Tax=Sphingobacterium wenxiniae TaxID=683125 RepID=A0A1I6PYS8_9SPHI|nr:amino acid permease [Sphingobacterium wenxiniae]SFS45220.1 Amino acid transporter [Sphingobacterium wenxiniae]